MSPNTFPRSLAPSLPRSLPPSLPPSLAPSLPPSLPPFPPSPPPLRFDPHKVQSFSEGGRVATELQPHGGHQTRGDLGWREGGREGGRIVLG